MAKHKRPKKEPEFSPGALYKEIPVDRSEFEEGGATLKAREHPPFVRLCKRVYKFAPGLGDQKEWEGEYKDAMAFLAWALKPQEFSATVKAALIAGILLGLLFIISVLQAAVQFGGGSFFGLGTAGFLVAVVPGLAIAFYPAYWVQRKPLNEVSDEQKRAIGYIPEIIGYLIMSLKLSPNLEKAVEFTAQHGRGKIATDFKEILWGVATGKYATLTEGLDRLTYTWGKYSNEFKRAMMRVRAAVLEDTESKRFQALDRAMDELLEAIRLKMEQYARSLSGPSVTLFYVGVLLPLILVIILPVGSTFTAAPLALPSVLFLLYNVVIPLFVFWYARRIILNRPPTYEPPKIPDSHPGLPPQWGIRTKKMLLDLRVLLVVTLVLGAGLTLFFSQQGFPPKFLVKEPTAQNCQLREMVKGVPLAGQLVRCEYLVMPDRSEEQVLLERGRAPNYFLNEPGGVLYDRLSRGGAREPEDVRPEVEIERIKFFLQSENDTTPLNLIFGSLITLSLLAFLFFHFRYIYKIRVQDDIMEMESEFKDSLYIIASRLGENRPIEDAVKHARDFLPEYKVSKRFFGRIIDNINLMGMPFEAAVFDQRYGALVAIPSNVFVVAMKVVVDSVRLGVNVAARTIVSLSLQMDSAEKVNLMLKNLVADITGMMVTLGIFIMPIVLGITTALQKIVILTLADIVTDTSGRDTGILGGGPGAGTFDTPLGDPAQIFESIPTNEVLITMATPFQFMAIIVLYVIELVIIITYFAIMIEEDNYLKFRWNLHRAIPIALITFVISVVVANVIIASTFGG